MAPLVTALAEHPDIQHTLCVSGQHLQMLTPILDLFSLRPDVTLQVMQPGQSLSRLASRVLTDLDEVLLDRRPDCVLVHGDTTTAMSAALAAFHARCEVGHVEAGLRTGNLGQPFPEEMNRRVIDAISTWLFAPTDAAYLNLGQENLPGRCWVTGNTVIDALAKVCQLLDERPELAEPMQRAFPFLDDNDKLVLVTGHRRENHGRGMLDICEALKSLAAEPGVKVVYPVHLNPQVQGPVRSHLGDQPNIFLIPPVDYLTFVWLMRRAHFILTDSGGVQEEAPFLQKPVLVMRDVTERPEAVANGTARLVGTDPARIVGASHRLLYDQSFYASFIQGGSPYGDGLASARIIAALRGQPVTSFAACTPLAA